MKRISLVGMLFALVAGAPAALASYDSAAPAAPDPFLSSSAPTIYSNGPITLMTRNTSMSLSGGATTTLLPPSGNFTVSSFFDVFTELSVDGGNTWLPYSSTNSPITEQVSGGPQLYDTEMLSMDLMLNGPGGPVMIRESPTLASLGQTSLTPQGSTFHIDSFFDIFTELSLDGGQTWTPSQGSTHFTGSPEPGTVCLLALGTVALLKRRRI